MTLQHSPSPAPLRIALVAPPMKAVPPIGYGGTERVVASLASGLIARGHDVTVFTSGDAETEARIVPIVPRALWETGYRGDVAAYMQLAAAMVWRQAEQFDVIHSHLENHGFLLARYSDTPVVTTLHGRLDVAGMDVLLGEFRDVPLVAISANQRRWLPDQNWLATIHHGLPLDAMPARRRPGDYLVVVGRMSAEKGIVEAIELSRRTGIPLRIAAKVHDVQERELFEEVRSAFEGGSVTFLGEVRGAERDELMAGALATLMLGSWPEPFGLVAIESLATGTPVIARRSGALPEIVEPGVDGFLVDDLIEAEQAVRRVGELDRIRIRKRALERFSTARMAGEYETVYRRLIARRQTFRLATGPRDHGLDALATPNVHSEFGLNGDDALQLTGPSEALVPGRGSRATLDQEGASGRNGRPG
ncbi:MAG: glycosyltransferase family 4 protein [Propionibacteriaceae bacterium]|nr:glycosyltransferase family 4 protein [Propionibacteriaceae bacterium]